MDIHQVLKEATKAIESCNSQQQLQDVKVAYLGKKGKITGAEEQHLQVSQSLCGIPYPTSYPFHEKP